MGEALADDEHPWVIVHDNLPFASRSSSTRICSPTFLDLATQSRLDVDDRSLFFVPPRLYFRLSIPYTIPRSFLTLFLLFDIFLLVENTSLRLLVTHPLVSYPTCHPRIFLPSPTSNFFLSICQPSHRNCSEVNDVTGLA